jgi:hypothetical protein
MYTKIKYLLQMHKLRAMMIRKIKVAIYSEPYILIILSEHGSKRKMRLRVNSEGKNREN